MSLNEGSRQRDLLPGFYTLSVAKYDMDGRTHITSKLFFGRAFRDQDNLPETANYNLLEELIPITRVVQSIRPLIKAFSIRR